MEKIRKKNKILTKCHNKCLNKNMIFNSLHAEMSVIQQLKRMNLTSKQIKRLTILVIRINKSGFLKQSKPLIPAVKAIFGSNLRIEIGKLLYSFSEI